MRFVVVILVLGLLQACGGPIADQGAGPSTTVGTPNSTATTFGSANPPERISTTTLPPITGEVPNEFLEPVLEDAAQLAGVEVSELEVVRSQAVEWPDGSLGCPQPGEEYIQVIIPGYWIEIIGPGGPYDYRLDAKGNFRLCEQEIPIGSSRGTPVTTIGGEPSD